MTPCSRACCWNPWGCSRAYSCKCHWEERKPNSRNHGAAVHSDPTANQAIRNVMKENPR